MGQVIFQPRVALSPRVRRNLAAYLFIGPALFLLVLFNIWPALYTAWLSLQDYGILGSNGFIGLENYAHILRDGLFWHSLLVTSIYTVGSASPARSPWRRSSPARCRSWAGSAFSTSSPA